MLPFDISSPWRIDCCETLVSSRGVLRDDDITFAMPVRSGRPWELPKMQGFRVNKRVESFGVNDCNLIILPSARWLQGKILQALEVGLNFVCFTFDQTSFLRSNCEGESENMGNTCSLINIVQTLFGQRKEIKWTKYYSELELKPFPWNHSIQFRSEYCFMPCIKLCSGVMVVVVSFILFLVIDPDTYSTAIKGNWVGYYDGTF